MVFYFAVAFNFIIKDLILHSADECFFILELYGGEKILESNSKVSKTISVQLTKQEDNLIKIIRNIDFGEVRIVITDGRPTRIEEIKKSIKL